MKDGAVADVVGGDNGLDGVLLAVGGDLLVGDSSASAVTVTPRVLVVILTFERHGDADDGLLQASRATLLEQR